MKKAFLILIFLYTFIFAQYGNDIKVINSNNNFLILEFRPVFLDSISHYKESDNTVLPLFSGASDPDFKSGGYEDYRFRSVLIGLKDFNGNNTELISSEYIDLINTGLKKIKPQKINGEIIYNNSLHKPKFTNDFEIAKFANIGLVRDRIVGNLEIYPYQYLENQNKVRVFTKIIIKIQFGISGSSVSLSSKKELLELNTINEDFSQSWKYRNDKINKNTLQNSVLSSGKWFRIKVTEEGIYKLDYTFLKNKGIDLTGVDPRTIKIYGNGGRLLDEKVENKNQVDLVENAIQVIGEDDGKFDATDYILFYGIGTKGPYFDRGTNSVRHYFHYYSDDNYYWLTYGVSNGKRMAAQNSLSSQTAEVVNSVDGFIFNHEPKRNLSKTGRIFYGDDFNDKTTYRVYNNKLPGLIPASTIKYRVSVVSRSPNYSTFLCEDNGTQIGTIALSYVYMSDNVGYYAYERDGQFTRSSDLTDSRSILKLTYQITSSVSEGFLNYFEIVYPRYLSADGDKIAFFSPNKSGIFDYKIGNFSNSDIKAFSVSKFSDINYIVPLSISGSEIRFQCSDKKDTVSRYFLVGANGYLQPAEIVSISNQNLIGISPGAEFIIITPKSFYTEAERLKNYKISRKYNPLKTAVVNVEDIYNEFSGGVVDISAIRDFIRYAYINWEIKPSYVLLFGDGNYDYRNLEGYGNNLIPPFETIESLYQMQSFPTDDFYARINGDDLMVDIAIGRLNVRNLSEAKVSVDKIINYETNSDFGEWRNRITFIADDGLQAPGEDDRSMHTDASEYLANYIVPDVFDKNKIYLILYPTVESSLGRRKPAVNKAIIDIANEGTVLMNYVGHGNPNLWAHESVFEKATSIPQLINSKKLFFLTAATCDFGEYDNPSTQSSTELMVLKSDGGCIGGITSARIVWSNLNRAFNEALYSNFFSWMLINSSPVSVGWGIFRTKITKYDDNDQKYHLFGDPTVYLNIPKDKSVIDSVNGSNLSNFVLLKALEKNNLKGSVRDSSGAIIGNYNGEAIITVFDSKKIKTISEWKYDVILTGGIVFKGRSKIINGKFSADFIIPKDISYSSNPGKVSIYFQKADNDGSGYTNNVKIVAADSGKINDKNGPLIDIFLDNENSKYAVLVNQSPLLIVKLEDENGINTTGTGLGHNIEAVLNNDFYSPIDLTNYFAGELDKGNLKGEVRYKFSDLEVGNYNLKLTAYDVYNNASKSEINFEVIEDGTVDVKNVYNYPNPFRNGTVFTFQHSYNQPVNYKIKIYTINGRLIQTLERNNIEEKFVKFEWDGRDSEGDLLGNGLYFYKIILQSIDGSFNKEIIGKMSVIK